MSAPDLLFEVRGLVANAELAALHGSAFGYDLSPVDWQERLQRHSITWVTARDTQGRLVGFVNVVGDGGEHAFLLDTMVSPQDQRSGVGRHLVDTAADAASQSGSHWLHVDYELRYADFYEQACGFHPVRAGLRDLRAERTPGPPTSGQPALKYARVERERRWVLAEVPDLAGASRTVEISDRYVRGSRLRLREVTEADGPVVRKLGHKVRLDAGAREVACTSLYLDDSEWDLLVALPADLLEKRRSIVPVEGGGTVAVDVLAGDLAGLVLAEIDSGDGQVVDLPASILPIAEVTDDESFTGAALSLCSADELAARLRHLGVPS